MKPMGLPSIGSRGGNFEVDSDYLKKANAELHKFDEIADFDYKPAKQEVDTRSMAEVLKAKRAEQDAREESKGGLETVQQRKARLMAQRDAMREAKKKQMAEELVEFNQKTKTQEGLYEELRKIDDKTKQSQSDAAELERRRQILQGVKKQIQTDDAFKTRPAAAVEESKRPEGWSALDDIEANEV